MVYNIYRDGNAIATGIEGTSYVDTPLVPNRTYTYQISEVNDLGESELSDPIEVTTEPVYVEAVEITTTDKELEVGQEKEIDYSITPSGATNKNVNYSSSNEDVIMIDGNNLVAIDEGTAVITVVTEDGEYTDSIQMRVMSINSEEIDENNGRKKIMNKKLGIKEVADVVFFDLETNKPVLVFDTLKVSNLENTAESAQATGGKGNSPLRSWDYGRSATLTMQDALISDQSLAMLAGTAVRDARSAGVNIVRTEVVVVGTDGAITTKHTPVGAVNAYVNEEGAMGEEVTVTDTAGVLTTDAQQGDRITVHYESEAEEGSSLVTFSSDKFPSLYRVVGTGLGQDGQGKDRVVQFQIPRAKLQSNFTLTMDPENVSAFDFNLEILADGDKELYSIIRA